MIDFFITSLKKDPFFYSLIKNPYKFKYEKHTDLIDEVFDNLYKSKCPYQLADFEIISFNIQITKHVPQLKYPALIIDLVVKDKTLYFEDIVKKEGYNYTVLQGDKAISVRKTVINKIILEKDTRIEIKIHLKNICYIKIMLF